jgi:hypothetical protein
MMAAFIKYKNTEFNLEMLVQISHDEYKDHEITRLHFQTDFQTIILKQIKANRDKEMDEFIALINVFIRQNRW